MFTLFEGWGGRAERETHRIPSRHQAPSCHHRAWHGAQTHKPWDHDLSRSWTLNWLSHPDTPRKSHLKWSQEVKRRSSQALPLTLDCRPQQEETLPFITNRKKPIISHHSRRKIFSLPSNSLANERLSQLSQWKATTVQTSSLLQ